jgi:hypothetical protein
MAEALYTIDFNNAAELLLADEFRDDVTINATGSMLSAMDDLHKTFNYMMADAENDYPLWFATMWYKYERVILLETGEVYECVADSTTNAPLESDDWVKVLDTFLGVDESRYYDGSRVQLEKALNKRFFLNFSITTGASDIYINTVTHSVGTFISGGSIDVSSYSSQAGSSPFFSSGAASYTDMNCFTINYPAADYALLGADAEKIVRRFVDQYAAFGLPYTIQTY